MKTNLNFTLANFQDRSAYVEYYDDCPACGWKVWENLYLTDLVVDGKATGKAYSCFEYQDWAIFLDLQSDHEAPSDQPEVNFTLDGTTWYSVWYGEYSTDVTKRADMDGRPREDVPEDSPEYAEVMKTYARLTELVSAVAAKEPPKKS